MPTAPTDGPPAPQPQTTNGLAVAALVSGILGLTVFFGVGSIAALVFGYVARGQIKRSEGRESGNGLAIAGLVMGWIGVVIGLIVAALIAVWSLALFGWGESTSPSNGVEIFTGDTVAYEDNGVTFQYPAEWDEFPAEPAATSAGSNELWSATVGPDRTNLLNITAYRLNIAITDDNADSIEAELDRVIGGVVEQAGGQITAGPTKEDIAGYPAYTYTWEDVEVDGDPKDSSAYFVFVGDIEYFFNCQYSGNAADDVQAGCEQILRSFEVTRSS